MSIPKRDIQGVRLYTQFTSSVTPSSNTVTFDLSAGSIINLNWTQDISTINITNVPSQSTSFVVFISASGGQSIQWPGSIRFNGGTAPTLTTSSNAVDVLAFTTNNNGDNWYGNVGGQRYNYSVTPSPVNWTDVSANTSGMVWQYSTQRITNISMPITLVVAYTPSVQLYYKIDNDDPGDPSVYNENFDSPPSAYGFSSINNMGTISVSNGQWLTFGVQDIGTFGATTVGVANQTDGNTSLDTFNATATP